MRLLVPALFLACSAPLAAQSVAVATSGGSGQSRSSVTVTAAIGQQVRINSLVLRPVAVVEDSRCPTRVTCVWRGRLVVEVAHGPRHRFQLEDGKPMAIAGGRLTLVGASPRSRTGETVASQAYRFQLRFERP